MAKNISYSRPNVALIVETSVVYGREILRGVCRFLGAHGPWSVFLDERELDAPPPDWLIDWPGDGVICRSTTPELAQRLRARNVPVVDLNDRHGDLGFPRITSDMRAIGACATEWLTALGYRSIAYCGFEGEPWCTERLEGLRELVEPVSVFRTPWRALREHSWPEERDLICAWLKPLPRPLGIVACNDVRGYHVLDACRTLGISIPEEVAVVGVDNAETFCALCDPPLTSVVPNAELIGFEAATLLNRMMAGEAIPVATRYVPPNGVVARKSTDSVAIPDPLVAALAAYVREMACGGLGVPDLVQRSDVSRSTLERRFRSALGCSPHDLICATRIKRVKQLLEETAWPLAKIADASGFDHPEYMMVQFKRETGQTPTEYRVIKNLSALH